MSLFMTKKKREAIGDEIDDLLMKQYYKRCSLEEANERGDKEKAEELQNRIDEIEEQIEKLRKKLK